MSDKELPKGYTCKCGIFNRFEMYVYAHWNELLIHSCECGRKNKIVRGIVMIGNKPRQPKPVDN